MKPNFLIYFSGTAITLALISYSYAVWGEQITKKLKGIFIAAFLIGFTLDLIGTGGMFLNTTGRVSPIHGILGISALIVMGIHAIWATSVWLRENKEAAKYFHRYSKFAYILWLLAFFSGPLLNRII
ncbi:MAG: TIGR03987 family protein [Candidatus Schekmanbacteria bacterium RIFCSPHIGHO2_02_FULL_38_11]|uniref:TIGR03987 family protein n=1 Tax=Candidatus Schekmanbacteria bacterium RIFCSPLOWO2_12_FULL_38_15 TaxID=1817883 RepID=A0A1F7SFP8_9BACT|nr:MAG: TIGR03987 family protein [Candidatus Schekmanbacteria bacterium RIFCSPLOWO2_02_FULL_38_14]OGL50151.1 MAG: TIGR03987 family protein [Candidatus Schekmanbacteria bacterium RIFCSPHIGHO2_02_FULL_38_11]OGL52585.1 MAG: TIGR03987 family protein [Candidatus Schekmanbacteria bacterium RIFCSPLOWO2_12_FULL_38_15]